jgi:regulator of protease activity HflC (stomatin/prohibitin superfamily)
MDSRSAWIGVLIALVICTPLFIYSECRIDVPNKHMAVLTHQVGKDLEKSMLLAPSTEYKGVQQDVLTEGRYYYNPYCWDWTVSPQIEIPEGKLGVRIRLYGNDLPAGELLAWKEDQKGIVPEVLRPGRYPINAIVSGEDPKIQRTNYIEIVELHDSVTIPAGYKGLIANCAGAMPSKMNQVISDKGERGIQPETLEPGTYYLNPYSNAVRLVDCRSQRYNLQDIGFPSRDGFWVTLEGIIEFRIDPKKAAEVYCLFNEESKGRTIDQEIVRKILLPNALAYARMKGANHSGKEFITGDTRANFQEEFQKQMRITCSEQGIEVIQALITTINPPEKIADPVRRRQVAIQQQQQYQKELIQQGAEQELAVQKATVEQKKSLVSAQQEVVVVTTEARKKQEMAVIDANKRLAVAEQQLLAAKDQASAIMAKGKAAADVIRFGNEAEAAGWQKSIVAFSGNGLEFAKWTLYKKLAPAFKSMTVNTHDSPLMDAFKSFDQKSSNPSSKH